MAKKSWNFHNVNQLFVYIFSDEDSELSEWSEDEDPVFESNFFNFAKPEDTKSSASAKQPFLPKFEKKPVTHLPGVKEPLKPPETISDFENCDLPLTPAAAQAWISEHLMPPYW